MAKKSVSSSTFGGRRSERMSNVLAGKSGVDAPSTVRSASVLRNPAYGAPVTRMAAYGNAKDQSRVKQQDRLTPEKQLPAGSIDIRGYFGDERTGIRKAGVGTGRKVTPASAAAPIKTQVKPAETIRTFVREKLTPTRKTGPQMGLNRVTGNTTGFSSGTKTGKTITKSGVATKTPMSASRRAEQNAFNKGGVAGPSRGGGGGSFRSSGGGRGMTGGGGMGASGRGTGGKK